MSGDAEFRRDLYRGTADDYDRHRVGYPPALVADLVARTGPDGRGRLLDLACGTGLLTFALLDRFAEVWAVDQEPGMVEVVRRLAGGDHRVRTVTAAAEDLSAPAASFELVAIGNAFHRLPRDRVAARVAELLRPGGHVALVWGRSPWDGDAGWQRAMAGVLDAWRARAGAGDRVPAGWQDARAARPDATVLAGAGLEPTGSWSFPTAHHWTLAALTGFAYTTSFLSRDVLGARTSVFEADLAAALRPYEGDGGFAETIDFAYELARRP